jgi:cell division inhibitor SepF
MSSRFMNMMMLNNEEEFEEMVDDNSQVEEETEEVEKKEKRRLPFFHKNNEVEEEEEEEPVPAKTTRVVTTQAETRRTKGPKKVSNIVSIGRGDGVKVVKPQSYNEVQMITDNLMQGKTIVLNLEGIENVTAQRIIDFMSGAVYAVGGALEAISNMIFIIAPKNVEISGDLRDELFVGGLISPDLGSL